MILRSIDGLMKLIGINYYKNKLNHFTSHLSNQLVILRIIHLIQIVELQHLQLMKTMILLLIGEQLLNFKIKNYNNNKNCLFFSFVFCLKTIYLFVN